MADTASVKPVALSRTSRSAAPSTEPVKSVASSIVPIKRKHGAVSRAAEEGAVEDEDDVRQEDDKHGHEETVPVKRGRSKKGSSKAFTALPLRDPSHQASASTSPAPRAKRAETSTKSDGVKTQHVRDTFLVRIDDDKTIPGTQSSAAISKAALTAMDEYDRHNNGSDRFSAAPKDWTKASNAKTCVRSKVLAEPPKRLKADLRSYGDLVACAWCVESQELCFTTKAGGLTLLPLREELREGVDSDSLQYYIAS